MGLKNSWSQKNYAKPLNPSQNNTFLSSFFLANRAEALYAVDSLKDKGVCRVCADCVNCEASDEPDVKRKSSAPGVSVQVGSCVLMVLSLILIAALQ